MDMRWRISRLDERRDTGVIIGHLINNQPLVPAEFRVGPSDLRPCQTSGAKPSQGQLRPRRKVGAGGSGPLRTRVPTLLRGLGVLARCALASRCLEGSSVYDACVFFKAGDSEGEGESRCLYRLAFKCVRYYRRIKKMGPTKEGSWRDGMDWVGSNERKQSERKQKEDNKAKDYRRNETGTMSAEP